MLSSSTIAQQETQETRRSTLEADIAGLKAEITKLRAMAKEQSPDQMKKMLEMMEKMDKLEELNAELTKILTDKLQETSMSRSVGQGQADEACTLLLLCKRCFCCAKQTPHKV